MSTLNVFEMSLIMHLDVKADLCDATREDSALARFENPRRKE